MSAHVFYPKDPSLDSRYGTKIHPNQKPPPNVALLNEIMENENLGSNHVTVVGLIGKSRTGKHWLTNAVLDKPLFQCCIEMYHDVSSNIIYLQLISVEDHVTLSNMCRALEQNLSEADFHLWLEKQEYHHLKALLFLFMSCHMILVVHPNHILDLAYLRILRILGSMKNIISETAIGYLQINGKGIQEFKFSSPFFPGSCIPILAFVFNDHMLSHLKETSSMSNSSTSSSPSPSLSPSPSPSPSPLSSSSNSVEPSTWAKYNAASSVMRTKIQNGLDIQISTLLKKTVLNSEKKSHHRQHHYAQNIPQLFSLDQGHVAHVVTLPTEFENCGALFPIFGENENQFFSFSLFGELSNSASASSSENKTNGSRELDNGVDALRQWILQKSLDIYNGAFTKKNENLLPTSRGWYLTALLLQDIFLFGRKILGRGKGRGEGDAMEKLKVFLDPDYKFSSSRCRDVMSASKEEYYRDLPEAYTTEFHERKLQRVYGVFSSVAVGPARSHYWEKLLGEFTSYWMDGHQMCDAVSLTKRNCVYKKHRLPSEPASDSSDKFYRNLPVREHSSENRAFHACNCGATRAIREDPFDLEVANKTFYERDCCHPFTQGQTVQQTRFNHFEVTPYVSSLTKSPTKIVNSPTKNPSSKYSSRPPPAPKIPPSVKTPTKPSPSTILLNFPEYSLSVLGTSKYYVPERGLQQDGFLPGYNFMMAWDIALGMKEKDKADVPPSSASSTPQNSNQKDNPKETAKNQPKRKRGRKKDRSDERQPIGRTSLGGYFDVLNKERDSLKRVFIGFEYESQNGHRFLLNEEMIKTRSGHKHVLQMGKIGSLPLFLKSPSSGTLSQLQRIFVVTPKEGGKNSNQVLVINPIVEFVRKPEKSKRNFSNVDPVSLQQQFYLRQQQQKPNSQNQPTRYIFRFPSPIILTWDTCVCFRLPYIYTTPDLDPLIQYSYNIGNTPTTASTVPAVGSGQGTSSSSSPSLWPALPTYSAPQSSSVVPISPIVQKPKKE